MAIVVVGLMALSFVPISFPPCATRPLVETRAPHAASRVHVLAAAQKGGKGPNDADEAKKPKMSFDGLLQLMTMGAGAPSLGQFKRWEGTKAMFELEANNFADEDGNVRRGKYVDDGYVDSDSSDSPPNFFANLFSGGQLQREYTDRQGERGPAKKR